MGELLSCLDLEYICELCKNRNSAILLASFRHVRWDEIFWACWVLGIFVLCCVHFKL